MKILGMHFIHGVTACEFQAGRFGIRVCHLWGGNRNKVIHNLKYRITFRWFPKEN